MSNPAMSARLAKEKRPENYCPKCLFRIVGRTGEYTPCPKHPTHSGIAHAIDIGLDPYEVFG